MARLLVSVRSAAEAREALAGGAALIDVKEPERGALGAADAEVVREVIRTVAGRAPVSAALGELSRFSDNERANAEAILALPGLDFAKVGLAGMATRNDWAADWRDFLRRFPATVRPVAVIYADAAEARAPSAEEVLQQASAIPAAAILIDTFRKDQGSLFDRIDDETLSSWIGTARHAGMWAVVAGSLKLELIARAAALTPDWIAVRGAACVGDRSSAIDINRVAALARQLATGRREKMRRSSWANA